MPVCRWRGVCPRGPRRRRLAARAGVPPALHAGAWHGARLDLQRWSAGQQAALDLHGVAGVLDPRDGVKNCLATTVGGGCRLGAALAQTAGAEASASLGGYRR